MSTHLLIAAAYLEDLDPTVKLALMAVADSADEHTLEAAPGLPKLRAWSGRSKSQVTRIVAELESSGYLERVSPGRLGRRAIYRVFPTGVPAIPHPDEVRDRYIEQVVPNVENVADYPQDDAEEGRTHAPHRGASTPSEGRTHAPPSCTISVPLAQPTDKPPARRVDNAPPARSTGSGFPGSRATAEEDRAAARRARGAANVACPFHPAEVQPCRRCAHAAAEDRRRNPDAPAQALKAAREALHRNRHTNPEERTA